MAFADRVLAVVAKIPPGRVTSYGIVAALAGSPRSARAVGTILRLLPTETNLPWQRVISSSGRLSILNFSIPAAFQAELLKQEGVEVEQKKGQFWIKQPNNFWQED